VRKGKRKGTEEGIEKRMEGGSWLVTVLGTPGVRKGSEKVAGFEDGVFAVSALRLLLSWTGGDPPRKEEPTLDETAGGLLEALLGGEEGGGT
jgi:hypothetical protein